MSQIAVQIFQRPKATPGTMGYVPAEDLAKEAYKDIQKAVKEGKIQVESGTIVVKDDDGNVSLRKTTDMTAGRGAGRGAFWGLLVGIIFAGPLAGLLAGLGLGAILGGKAAKGIDRNFMKQLAESMKPGNAALFLLIPEGDEATVKYLDAFEGPLYLTPLTDDVEEAIDKAAVREDVLEAIKFDEL